MFHAHNGVPRYSAVGFAKRELENASRLLGKWSKELGFSASCRFDGDIDTGSSAIEGAMSVMQLQCQSRNPRIVYRSLQKSTRSKVGCVNKVVRKAV